jgi:hypothetical protein
MNTLSWKGTIGGFTNDLYQRVDVNLASGWDEYPHDCTEQMEIKEMGFYRAEFFQSRIDWTKFTQATAKIRKDRYGRRIIDPEKENH